MQNSLTKENYHVMVGDTLVKITASNPKHKTIYPVGAEVYLDFDIADTHVL